MLEAPLTFVTGKGGTGRSALTAALALAAARSGSRVLALSLGAPAGLARHLDHPLPAFPADIGEVHAAAVTPPTALAEYLSYRTGRLRAASLARLLSVVVETVPGIRDLVMMGKVVHEARSGWDAVVVDAPPVGQFESYAGAAGAIAGLVPEGPVATQAREVRDWLDSSATTTLIAATSDELAVTEAEDLARRLAARGMRVGGIVANKLLPPPEFAAPHDEPDPGRREAGLLHSALFDQQTHALRSLSPVLEVPFHFGASEASLPSLIAEGWSR